MRARLNARVDPIAGDPAAAMRGLREGATLVSERPSRGVARRIPRTRSRLVELLSSRGRVEIVVEVVESGDAHAAARARAIAG